MSKRSPYVKVVPFDVGREMVHVDDYLDVLMQLNDMEAKMRIYQGIAGAGLSGTDEADEIAAKFPNKYDAFNEAIRRIQIREQIMRAIIISAHKKD